VTLRIFTASKILIIRRHDGSKTRDASRENLGYIASRKRVSCFSKSIVRFRSYTGYILLHTGSQISCDEAQWMEESVFA
jgi:hypothetical protein